ncbi:hypothetical protein ABH944_007803 [Caballeronia udeis]|uniref:Uncharacterized protein n=1 Tax=Caballeronia udeis TaxID=1232866 RepID=A0ABW8MUQ3_9BURK
MPIAAALYGMVFPDKRPTIPYGIALASMKAKTAPSIIS